MIDFYTAVEALATEAFEAENYELAEKYFDLADRIAILMRKCGVPSAKVTGQLP